MQEHWVEGWPNVDLKRKFLLTLNGGWYNGMYAVDGGSKNNSQSLENLWNDEKGEQGVHGKNWMMVFIMSLVQKSQIANLTKEEMFGPFLRFRWSNEIMLYSPCLNESQIFDVIFKTAKHLRLKVEATPWIRDDDLALGIELLTILQDCSSHLVESVKMGFFFEDLITHHSLETVIASTMNSIRPRANKTMLEDFSSVNMWYNKLDDIFKFSLGDELSALTSTKQQRLLSDESPPFWTISQKNDEGKCCQSGKHSDR